MPERSPHAETRSPQLPAADAAIAEFEQFYLQKFGVLSDATSAIIRLLRASLDELKEELAVHDVAGRVKTFESCVEKYDRKYRGHDSRPICECLTDLIGIRVVCLYEDDIDRIATEIGTLFEVINITNKIETMNKNVDKFGYKAFHCDMQLGRPRGDFAEYRRFAGLPAELQIRTIFQDAWSVIDHQLKYKKKVATALARRINVFAALCELADQEFIRIRDDIRAAPAQLEPTSVQGINSLSLREFLEILRGEFPTNVILPDQADILLVIIKTCDPTFGRPVLLDSFRKLGAVIQENCDAFKARTNRELSPLTRTRLLLSLADPKFAGLVTSRDMRNLKSEISKRIAP